MDDWYEQLVEGQGKVHDRICNDGEACSDRENHIENTYVPIALKTLVEHMKTERAAELAGANKTFILTTEEWNEQRERVAREMVKNRHTSTKGQAYHMADDAMRALGFRMVSDAADS